MADTYTVKRSLTINAQPDVVYAQIGDFHRWEAWSPWQDVDPNMSQTYAGSESGTGAVVAWKGNRKAGEGRMEITEAVEASKVVIALDFVKPFKSSNTTTFDLAPEGDGTRVTWTMVGPNTFMIKVMGVFKSMDKMIGSDFEKGLSQLKTVTEQQA